MLKRGRPSAITYFNLGGSTILKKMENNISSKLTTSPIIGSSCSRSTKEHLTIDHLGVIEFQLLSFIISSVRLYQ